MPLTLEPYVHARAPHVVVLWSEGLAGCTNPLLCVAVCSDALVVRGHSPADMENERQAKKMLNVLKQSYDITGVARNDKRSFAAVWWKEWLMVMDFMPKCTPPAHPSPTPANACGLLHTHCTRCSLSVCFAVCLRAVRTRL